MSKLLQEFEDENIPVNDLEKDLVFSQKIINPNHQEETNANSFRIVNLTNPKQLRFFIVSLIFSILIIKTNSACGCTTWTYMKNTINNKEWWSCKTCISQTGCSSSPVYRYNVYDDIFYYQWLPYDQCPPCVANCNVCSNDVSCTTCKAGFYKNTTTASAVTCFACSAITNCLSCANGPVCNTCAGITTKSADGRSCLCPANCASCNSTECISCNGIYVLSTPKLACVCPAQCTSCNATQCAACAGIYILSGDKKSCTCPSNCLNCNTTECSTCAGIYKLSTTKTSCQCPVNCVTCNTIQCFSCIGIYVLSTSKTSCICPPNCQTCNATQCSLCTGIYVLSPTKTSCLCPPNCASCNSTECLQCAGIYKLSIDKKACQCPSNCLSCNSAECLLCDGIYKISTDKKSCQCPQRCLNCDRTQCYQCDGITILTSDKTACVCPANCLSCTAIECLGCAGIYLLSPTKTSCLCPPNCLSCNSSQCLQCSGIYKLSIDKKSCQCPPKCLSCNSTQCHQCDGITTLSPDKTACLCPANCLSCSPSECLSCDGIYLISPSKTSCQCPSNCLNCNSTECTLCDGIYKISTDKKSCQCPTNCMNCDAVQCYQCGGITTLSSDKKACLCPTNCLSCTHTECLACAGIYVLSPSKTSCQCPPNCLSCDSSQCFQCQGIYKLSSDKTACQCPDFCLNCNSTQCNSCMKGYKISPDRTFCIELMWGCLELFQFPPSSKNFQCAFCNYAHKIVLNTTTKKCQCTSGYQLDQASGKCVQICGDGLVYEAQCDDGNTISNDGCSDKCQIEKWFICNSNVKPTFCNTLMTISYEIEKIERSEQCESCAKVVLKPKNTFLPYPLYYQHFDPRQSGTPSHFLFSIAINKPPLPQQIFVPPYKILSVTDNSITLGFTFEFTVQGLNATIQLNYEKTRYLNTTQKLQFTLKGANHKLEFNNYYNVYENIQSSLLVTAIIALICLLIGLFVPKFIGLETILTMQLIFYSQMLVQSEQKWPYGFMVLKYLKFSTGYNEFLDLSEYYPLEYMYKRYFHLEISKTIAQNIQANFVIVMLALFAFFLLNYIRTGKQTQLKELISDKKQKSQEYKRNKQIKNLISVNNRWLKVNEVTYWMIAQLSVWTILPFMSCFSAQTLIDNKVVNYKYPNSIFLKLDTPLFLVITTVVFSILLNHFKNLYLSIRTQHKIHERPEELLYKQLLILYLFIVGIIIFFFNDLQIANLIPISLFVLILNLGFILILLKIKPYKQSLRIHQVSLIINHLLYAVFMVIINLINFLDTIKEIIILCLGYFIAGCVGMLILLTILRLYYEIRFGERLEKEIQLQRQKAEQQEKELQKKLLQQTRINLEYEAKQRLNQIQKQRDQNKYLIQTQVMQEQKASLLNWLQKRNIWSDKQKEKYYFKQFHQKPFQWLKKNDKAQFQRRIQEHQMKKKLDEQKKKARQQNPDFYNVASKLRFEFEEKMKNKAKKKGKVPQENEIKKEKRNTEND